VLTTTLSILARLGIDPVLLEPLDDVDRNEDLHIWQRIIESEESDLRSVSVIIPALNEAEHITSTIEAARKGGPGWSSGPQVTRETSPRLRHRRTPAKSDHFDCKAD